MSTSTTGPPPGFESMNVNSDSAAADVTAPDPTDVPQSTSLGGGDPRRDSVDYDPIVMLEIGGTEGTAEAVELGKTVIEPITWEDYLSPDTQDNMHHFVIGAKF
eukprot:s5071_g4.t1